LVKTNKTFNSGATKITESSSLAEIEKLLIANEKVVDKQFILTDVNYQSGMHRITSNSFIYLNRIVAILKSNSSINIHLKGHTDSDGDDEANFILSQKRARSVSIYLIKGGVEEHRITFEGYGESRSIASNKSKEGKRANRRVELLIISD